MKQAMRIMGHQYVIGRDIDEALKRSLNENNRAYCHSFDMLGEAALSLPDAERYFQAYRNAIDAIGDSVSGSTDIFAAPSISVNSRRFTRAMIFGSDSGLSPHWCRNWRLWLSRLGIDISG